MLPPDMSRKKYKDMTKEEKEIVKFFGFNEFEYDNYVLKENNYLELN